MINFEAKQALRQQMRKLRSSIPAQLKLEYEAAIVAQLKPLLDSLTRVAIYHAVGSEFNLKNIIDYCLDRGRKVYSPIAYNHSRVMAFEQVVTSTQKGMFYPDNYQIEHGLECYNLDLVLVPLLAVSRDGYRLGQGGGYYDTTFSNRNNTILCGVGFSCQMVDYVPYDKWDVKLDFFASEQALIKF